MLKIFVVLVAVSAFARAADPIRASVVLSAGDLKGYITFTQTPAGVVLDGSISGIPTGSHGFHIHEKGDLSNGCVSTGSHFNPENKNHGSPADSNRHVGDLGNIISDASKVAKIAITDNVIALQGPHNIIGRAVVVHADPDDLGKGGHNDSLTTGHAGARLACGIIGILSGDPNRSNDAFTMIPSNIFIFSLSIFAFIIRKFF